MSFGPIAKINPQYEDYPNWWLKGYTQGTTTPISMATDAAAGTLLAKAELDLNGFISTSGGALFIPYFNESYDLWLFPTEAEADANDTSNAIRMANNIDSTNSGQSGAVFNTVSDLIASASLVEGLVVRTLGYFAADDGGAGVYTIEAAQVVDSQGDHTLANGLSAILKKLSPTDIRQYGAIAGFTPDSAISAATAYEQDKTRVLHVQDDVTVISEDPLIPVTADMIFTGGGYVSGLSRKSVGPVNKFNSTLSASFAQNWELAGLAGQASIKVVLIGDSIATYSANTNTRAGMLTSVIENYFVSHFPSVTFTNRSIGATTYLDMDGTPATGATDDVDWYTNQATPWMDYVEALTPDVVIVAFGMNDSLTIDTAAVESVIDKIQAFAGAPFVSLCTNLNPSISGDGSSLYETPNWQNFRDIAAGYIRNVAKYRQVGLLDFNRKMVLARDGIDPVFSKIGVKEVLTVVDNGGLDESLGTTEVFNVKYVTAIDELQLVSGDFNTFVDFQMSPSNGDKLRITNDGGFMRLNMFGRGFGGQPDVFYDIVTTTEPIGAVTRNLCVEKYGNSYTVYRNDVGNGQYTDAIHTGRLKSLGGLFFPRVLGSGVGLFSATDVYVDDAFAVTPTVTDEELWGERDQVIGPYGGSGWNHPSTSMAVQVYEPVMGDINLGGVSAGGGGDTPINTYPNFSDTSFEASDVVAIWNDSDSENQGITPDNMFNFHHTGLTEMLVSPAADDELMLYDTSASEYVRIDQSLIAGSFDINGLPIYPLTSFVASDYIAVYDASAVANNKITPADYSIATHFSFTELLIAPASDDEILIYDTSDSTMKRLDISLLPSGAGSVNSFETIAVSGETDVVATTGTDTLTLVDGVGITITTDGGTSTITFDADTINALAIYGSSSYAASDYMAVYDASLAAERKITPVNHLVATHFSLTTQGSTAAADDEIMIYDTSTATYKRMDVSLLPGGGGAVDSVAGRTGDVVIVKADIADFGTYATTAQGTLADSALQSGDNISLLTNNSGYLTSAQNTTVSQTTYGGSSYTNSDFLTFYDGSAAANRKITPANHAVATHFTFSTETTPVAADEILVYDTSAGTYKRIGLDDLKTFFTA